MDARLQPWTTFSSRCPAGPRQARRATLKVSKSIVDGPRAAEECGRRFVVEPQASVPGAPVLVRGLPGLGRGRYPLSSVVAHVCRSCVVSFARMVLVHGDVEAARAVCLVLRTPRLGTGRYAALDGRLTVHNADTEAFGAPYETVEITILIYLSRHFGGGFGGAP